MPQARPVALCYAGWMRLTTSCWAVPGLCCLPPWWHNAGFVVGGDRTLVVDTGGNTAAAQTILGYATAVRPGQPLLAVNTEPHLDHLLGNAFFAERGIEILGHASVTRSEADVASWAEEVRACIPERLRRDRHEERAFFAGTRLLNPTRHVTEDTELDLGGLTAQLLLTPGHTAANLCVNVPEERVVYVADCLEPGHVPGLNGGPDDWRQWLLSLDRIAALRAEIAVPGHGVVLIGAAAIEDEVQRVRDVLREALRAGRGSPTPC
jgi:glyoxylase-like metal-dependent hydrolase (beta-lactamase superfamily II)